MLCVEKTYVAPSQSGAVVLGRTLPSLLDEACDSAPNESAFHRWAVTEWHTFSNQTFRAMTEALAVGLLDLGLEKGDRVAFLMHSDFMFCLADMACLQAGLVDVPIDLTQTLEHIIFVLQHSEAKVLIISNADLLTQIAPYLGKTAHLQKVILAETASEAQLAQLLQTTPLTGIDGKRSSSGFIPEAACLAIPMMLHPIHADQPTTGLPQCIQVLDLEHVKQQGQASASGDRLQHLRSALKPNDLATIIYIPDEMGHLQGVMLSHENLAANAIASFSGMASLKRGSQETVLSFLPLNHVLARVMLYGHICYGHCIYFSSPSRVIKHLKEVRPTVLVTVPLFLEKIYGKLLEKSQRSPQLLMRGNENSNPGTTTSTSTSIFFPLVVSLKSQFHRSLTLTQSLQAACTQLLITWALNVAQRYTLGQPPRGLYALSLKLADRLILSKWRTTFGNRLKYLICGGAPLNAEIVNALAAAGVMIYQGYGLTQASAVVCCNRGSWNRAGTVGVPIAGVEVAIADDDEILVRSPYVMQGYYKNSTLTRETIDADGWLHTGDLGTFTADGFLKITGLKKALFKLSTGKYIAPQPIEQRLKRSPLVAEAMVVGSEQKFCAVLIVPNLDALHIQAIENGIDASLDALLQHSSILALYRSVVDAANCHLPYWALVKRFRLLNTDFSVDNGLLTPTGQIARARAIATFAADINALYQDDGQQGREATSLSSAPTTDCPAFAQSLNPRLTT